MADQEYILAPATEMVKVDLSTEPAFNIINSMHLLSYPEERFGFAAWVMSTASNLPPELARRHLMIFRALPDAVMPAESWPSFAAYLSHLASEDALVMRDRAIQWTCKEHHGIAPLDPELLLRNRDAYLGYLEQIYAHKDKEAVYEPTYHVEAHALLNDPPALKALVVEHVTTMWEQYLAPEWERTLPMLRESVEAFQQLDYSHMTAIEAARVITGRDLSGVWDHWGKHITFIPSAHVGPYVTTYEDKDGFIRWLVFGARLPEGARVNSPALSRSELLVRLSALADDTRLQILELLTQHNELGAQDVMKMLDLTQSAASRHLRQLTATGYLVERRKEVAKWYSLNPQRVDDTLRALKRFLRAR